MNTTADRPTGPAFVVFGIGADKKPRAARFDDSQPKLVAKASAVHQRHQVHEILPMISSACPMRRVAQAAHKK